MRSYYYKPELFGHASLSLVILAIPLSEHRRTQEGKLIL